MPIIVGIVLALILGAIVLTYAVFAVALALIPTALVCAGSWGVLSAHRSSWTEQETRRCVFSGAGITLGESAGVATWSIDQNALNPWPVERAKAIVMGGGLVLLFLIYLVLYSDDRLWGTQGDVTTFLVVWGSFVVTAVAGYFAIGWISERLNRSAMAAMQSEAAAALSRSMQGLGEVAQDIVNICADYSAALDTLGIEPIFVRDEFSAIARTALSEGDEKARSLAMQVRSRLQDDLESLQKARRLLAELHGGYTRAKDAVLVSGARSLLADLDQVYQVLDGGWLNAMIAERQWGELTNMLTEGITIVGRIHGLASQGGASSGGTAVPDFPHDLADAYRILNVPSTATDAVIANARKALVAAWHPDKGPGGDLEKVKAINAAFDLIRQDRMRSK